MPRRRRNSPFGGSGFPDLRFLASLIAYDEGRQVGELDGCFLEADERGVRLTLVEAKRMNRGARGAAERSLKAGLRRLGLNPVVQSSPVSSELLSGGRARA